MMTFVEELKKSLTPGQLAVWKRRGTPECTLKDASYIALWVAQAKGEKPPKSSSLPTPSVCGFLGPETGETVKCRSCPNAAAVTFRCNKFLKLTTINSPSRDDGILCCKVCDHHPDNIRRRFDNERLLASSVPKVVPYSCHSCKKTDLGTVHLVYHILPVAENLTWKWNLAHLAARSKLFTGRKIFSIMTDTNLFSRRPDQSGKEKTWTLVPPEEVRRHLPPDAEVIERPNDPSLWESASWDSMFNILFSGRHDPSDKVFYAHAKGATRDWSLIKWWTEVMYSAALDHTELVASTLDKFPVAGSFQRIGDEFGNVPWHYHGTFFWSTVGEMRKRLADTPIQEEWWGSEAWPGQAFTLEESGVLFASGGKEELNLYRPAVRERWQLEYEKWLNDH